MAACRNCRNELLAEARFCIRCGTSVRATGILAQAASAVAAEGPEGLELAGERRVVTVLFTDISGFTAMSEKLDPETVVEILNAFFRVITEPVYRYGGIVDKYIGDAVMAIFGAPVAHEDDAERALRAAWDMQLAARRFAARLEARTGIPVAIRVGINTGSAIAGEVGSDLKREYTVLGDAVNVAQRMEANAPVGSTLVSENTWRLVRHVFRFSDVQHLQVKNRAEPVPAYELLDLAAGGHEAKTEVLGRRRELGILGQAWEDVERGVPQVVRLLGEPGCGKTALVGEFLETLPFGGAALRARCNSFDEHVPFSVPRALLLGELGLDGRRVVIEEVAGALARALPWKAGDPEGVDAIAFLLGADPGPTLAGLEPEHRLAVAFRHANDFFVDRARFEPYVLFCDDLQWADAGSKAWLAALEDRLVETPAGILLLLASRLGDRALAPDRARLAVMDLVVRPLSNDAAELLVRSRLDGEAPAHLVGEIVRRGAGNPEFLLALSEALSEARPEGVEPLAVLPQSLQAHLTARLDGLALEAGSRRTLEAAAVLGEECQTAPLAVVADAPDVGAAVRELRDRHVLVASPARPDVLAFRQPVLRDAVYGRVLAPRRRKLHERAAGHFAEVQEDPALAAEHYARAEAAGQAASAYLTASSRALSRFANEDALLLAEQARRWHTAAGPDDLPGDFTERAGAIEVQALAAMGRLEEAIARSRDLVAKPGSPAAALEHRERHAHLLLRAGDLAAARTVCDEFLASGATGLSERDLVKVRARRAQVRVRQGELREAIEDCETALGAIGAGAPALSGFIRFVCASAQCRLGELAAARATGEGAVKDLDAAGDLYHTAHARSDLAVILERLGEPAAAAVELQRSLEIALRLGDLRLRGVVVNNLAILEFGRGDAAAARALFEQALEIYRRIQDRTSVGLALMNLGEVLAAQAEPAAAERSLREAVSIFEAVAARDLHVEAMRQLASVLIERGEDDESLGLLQRYHTMARDLGQRETQGAALRKLSEIHARHGRFQEALNAAAQAVQVLLNSEATQELGLGYAQLASVLDALGQPARAASARDKASAVKGARIRTAGLPASG